MRAAEDKKSQQRVVVKLGRGFLAPFIPSDIPRRNGVDRLETLFAVKEVYISFLLFYYFYHF
jgi:hypothetical protein